MTTERLTERPTPIGTESNDRARLVTETIGFHSVPDFESTLLPLEVEVPTATPLTLEVITPPLAPFSIHHSPTASNRPAPPRDETCEAPDPRATATLRLWVRYDATGPCTTDRGSITVGLTETGQRWSVALRAKTVPAGSVG